MSDILKQIQSLKEDFMNLIEVEGLGDPSNEVPPSTNKIKRDRKTKDGKVEVVSVEDELFPYDGNKREQYRQKILDTINNMIQGTATLEDLLQIVRQKKMPVKEGLEKAIEILEEEIKKERKNNKQQVYMRMDDPEKNKIGVKKNYNRVIHNDSASKDPAFDYVKIKGTKYGVDKYGQIGAPLKEAFELMETALTAIRNSGLPKEKQQELTSKLAKGRAEERELADEKAFKSWAKGDRKQLDVQTVRDPEFTKNASGERKTRLRSHNNNYTKSGGRKIKPEWKQVEDSIKRHEKKVQKNSSLKEAMEVLEELIGEGRNLEDVVVRGYNKGKVSLDDLQKLMDKAHEVPSDSSYFHKSKGEKGELRTKHRHMDYERNVLSDGWGKDDNKKIEASIKRKAKNDKSFPVFQALKAYKEGKANIKEALSLMEAVINELHPDTVNNALDKRTEQSIEADDKERDEFNNILKIKDRDERAKAYKEFKKKADDRFAKEDKKLDLYFNYAKRHPELVKESLRDQIDKKVKAGEINLDKALKLDKKIEDKMSSEKNAQEYSDELDKRAKKERLGDKAVAKSIRRNERKSACEALELAEAIINEVSLKTWKEAAKNSIDKRKEAAENTAKAAEQSWDDYEEFSRKHPEEEDALYKRAWRNDIIAKKAEDRADHASDVLGIKAKGKSANKTIKAARNSETKRNDEYLQNLDPDKFNRLRTRMMKSDQLITADPVKSRAYESLEEALRLLEGLFVNDGRGDLIDNDIMNKPGWTRKTIENGITKVAKGCQKKVDNKEK